MPEYHPSNLNHIEKTSATVENQKMRLDLTSSW